jgi:hypothetical protein
MQWSVMVRMPKNQATWTVFIIRVIFNNLTTLNGFFNLDGPNSTLCGPIRGVGGKNVLAVLETFTDYSNIGH